MSAFHDREPGRPGERQAWWFEPDHAALVLGSAQPDAVVDRAAGVRRGIEVVRRRSGGGAVLVLPGEMMWLDVVVPAGDPLWLDDIGRAMWWFGEVWAEALRACGVDGVEVHRGPVLHSEWSRLVCFDGTGAGEVLVGGRKAVGISQRRTRQWVRLQSSLHLAWRAELLVELLSPPRPTADQLAAPAVVDVDPLALRAALERSLILR